MLGLAGFTLWRAGVTAWRPLADRLYLFSNETWMGVVDRSWLNDFLLGPGTVACSFIAFTTLYAAGGVFGEDATSSSSSSIWADHKRLMKIILYGLLVRALIGGWGEEVGIFASDLVFDPWDLTVELGGIVLGAWLVHTLSYPLFSRVPHFPPEPDIPALCNLCPRIGIDMLSVVATGFYIVLVDPFELRPLTIVERQVLSLEVAAVFVVFRTGLKRGMNLSAQSVPIVTDAE